VFFFCFFFIIVYLKGLASFACRFFLPFSSFLHFFFFFAAYTSSAASAPNFLLIKGNFIIIQLSVRVLLAIGFPSQTEFNIRIT
jgi:hypothetical protein